MQRLSENFYRHEFRCKCSYGCGQDTVDTLLLDILQDLRTHTRRPVFLSSANRCPRHNDDEDGEPDSQHLLGKAADIVAVGKTPKQVQDYFDKRYPDQYGMGRYDGWTHIDSREVHARW